MFDIEKFIDFVHERPLLWDKKVKEHSDLTTRDLAWIEVGAGMYNDWLLLPTVEKEEKVKFMKSKWRHLRDNYLRSLKVDKNAKRKKYIYANHLEFLLDTFANRIPINNKHSFGNGTGIENDENNTYINGHRDSGSEIRNDNYEANESYSSDTIEDTYQLKDAQPNLTPTNKCQNTKLETLRPKLPTLKPKLPTLEPRLSTLEPKLPTANYLEASQIQEEDADLMFFNSLLPDYKELDEEEKLDFRIKCLQFIRDARKSRKS